MVRPAVPLVLGLASPEADARPIDRIWNTYKDDFARTRTRELNIIE